MPEWVNVESPMTAKEGNCPAFGHGDGGSHVHACVDGPERRQRAECVATYVAEYAGVLVLCRYFIEGGVHVSVSAALAECGRSGHYDVVLGEGLVRSESHGCADTVGRKLPGTWQDTVKTAVHLYVRADHAFYHLLYKRLTLFHDYYTVDSLGLHGLDQPARNRVAGYLEYSARNSVGEVLHQIVVCDTAGYDCQAFVLTGHEPVARVVECTFLEDFLILDELIVAHFRIGWQQYPLTGIFRV